MQELGTQIKALEHSFSVLSLQKDDAKSELADLVRTRTELECVVEDLKVAGERGEQQRYICFYNYLMGNLFIVTCLGMV